MKLVRENGSTRKGGMIRLHGGETKEIMRILLLRRLVEERRGFQITEAAEMLGCKPKDVGRILINILKQTPEPKKVSLWLDRRDNRIQMSGIFLFSHPWPYDVEWKSMVRRLKRRAEWKEVRKLPALDKTFTAAEAARILKLSPDEAKRKLELWRQGYVAAFFLSGEPVFWQRAF